MSTSANPDNRLQSATCTPHSIFRGLYVLAKTFLWENVALIAALGALALLVVGSSLVAVQAYHPEANHFAFAAIAAFFIGAGSWVLAYVKKEHLHSFVLGGLLSLAFHMFFVMLVRTLAGNELAPGADWWHEVSIWVQVAVMPMYAAMLVAQIALAIVLAGGAAVAIWATVRLPQVAKAAARYICQTGQGH